MSDRTRRGRGDGTVHQRATTMDTNTEGEDVTLTEFLLARIAEDEDLAERIEANPERPRGPQYVSGVGRVAVVGGGYLLAECEAKRRIVEGAGLTFYRNLCLRALALPYAGHPDYDEAWKP